MINSDRGRYLFKKCGYFSMIFRYYVAVAQSPKID